MRFVALLVALLFTVSAYAGRLTPSIRLSNIAHTPGAHSVSIAIPSGATAAVISFPYYNDASKQDPTGVGLDGIGATNRGSAGSPSTLYIATYTVTGFSTGAGKILTYTVPATGTTFALALAVEFLDGSLIIGDSDAVAAASPGPASTKSLANSNGNTILSAYATKDDFGSPPTPGVGQSKLDEVDDTSGMVYYGFTTETSTGAGDVQSIGFGMTANIPVIASVVLGTPSGPTIPPGSQGVVLTSIAAGSPVDTFNVTVTPDIAVGDYMIGPMVTTPSNCTLSLQVTGQISYQPAPGDVSGVCDTLRQSAAITFWDTSVGGTHADTLAWWDNNRTPVQANPSGSVVFKVPLNAPMTPTSLLGLCTDADGDLLTYTSVTTLPADLSITDNVLSGTATTRAITPVTFECTDIAGAATDFD